MLQPLLGKRAPARQKIATQNRVQAHVRAHIRAYVEALCHEFQPVKGQTDADATDANQLDATVIFCGKLFSCPARAHCTRAFSSEVDTGSREENASKQESRASVPIQSEPKMLAAILHDATKHRSKMKDPSGGTFAYPGRMKNLNKINETRVSDPANSRRYEQNMDRTGSKIDTPLTQRRSGDVRCLVEKIGPSVMRALRAVERGEVFRLMENRSSKMQGPMGIGPIQFWRCQWAKLIEDGPRIGVEVRYQQVLTVTGKRALCTGVFEP